MDWYAQSCERLKEVDQSEVRKETANHKYGRLDLLENVVWVVLATGLEPSKLFEAFHMS